MSMNEFYDASPADVHHILKEARKREESEVQRAYEIARFNSFLAVSPHVKKMPKITEFSPLPWDDKNKVIKPPPSKELIEKLNERDRKLGAPTVEYIEKKRKAGKTASLRKLAASGKK